jgi:hypothetical protein
MVRRRSKRVIDIRHMPGHLPEVVKMWRTCALPMKRSTVVGLQSIHVKRSTVVRCTVASCETLGCGRPTLTVLEAFEVTD